MYEEHLANKSIFFTKQTFLLFIVYFLIRLFSYLLFPHHLIQAFLVFLLLMILGILYFKKPEYGWYLLLGEFFLGGSGHYLEFLGLSIRTLFICFFLFLWFFHQLGKNNLKQRLHLDKNFTYLLITLFVLLFFSIINGIYHSHSWHQIVADFVPFILLFLIFPSYHLFQEEKTQEFLVRLLTVFILATAIFSIFTFVFFSNGWSIIHGDFYTWYRDINLGKITDLGNGFFRIVEPEHLLIAPLILFISSLLMRDEKHNPMWGVLRFSAIIILVLNLSRGYFLALLVGLLVLKYKHSWKKWLQQSFILITLIFSVFIGSNLLASGGKTLGLELFGIRLQSFVNPSVEISTETRMIILPEIWHLITQNPLLGQGLGAMVTFYNPLTYTNITTANFDWGYLEMWTELGILGALILLSFYFFVIFRLIKKIKNTQDWHDLDVGLLAGIIAFLVMNITIPALFHVYTILFIALVATLALRHTQGFERTIKILYRVFNRLKNA